MAQITLQGNPITTIGELPAVGSQAPDFELVKNDLSHAKLADYKGARLILNIHPSIDTGICAASVKKFNEEASQLENTKILTISKDLPFAFARFCGAEGIENVISMSDFINGSFGESYGLTVNTGPMTGLHSRAVVVLDADHKVIYTEQVAEIAQEPDYDKALASLS